MTFRHDRTRNIQDSYPNRDNLLPGHGEPSDQGYSSRDIEKATEDGSAASGNRHQADGLVHHKPHHSSEPLSFSERAMRVTWAWFPCTMSTGALASLINVQPFVFPGLMTIGKIFYILNLVLFLTFSALIALRFIRKPLALTTSLHHPSESFFFGSFWVSIALIINGAQGYGVPVAGSWLVAAVRVLFWIYIACALIVAVFQYHIIFEVEKLSLSDAVPAWILPAYPFLVTGTVAANIAETQPNGSALQILIAGLTGQGLGWMLAIFIYVVYLTRLIANDMPPPSTRPGMYVSVGPAAYTCAGLVGLGKQAQTVLPENFLGVSSVPVGDIWRSCSVAVALFLWLIAIWFSALSTVSILRAARRMTFTLQWWAFVFPNAGLAIATIQLGESLDSIGLQAFGSAITVVLVVLWFMCAICHLRALWTRNLLEQGMDLGVEEVNRSNDEKKIRRNGKPT